MLFSSKDGYYDSFGGNLTESGEGNVYLLVVQVSQGNRTLDQKVKKPFKFRLLSRMIVFGTVFCFLEVNLWKLFVDFTQKLSSLLSRLCLYFLNGIFLNIAIHPRILKPRSLGDFVKAKHILGSNLPSLYLYFQI